MTVPTMPATDASRRAVSSPGAAVISLLYDDDAMVVVDKPAGVAVIPAPGEPVAACLRDRVAAQIGTRAWVVHRLDRDTSGIVVFARTADAHRMLSMAFDRRDVERRYTALVRGVPVLADGAIDRPLHDARKGKVRLAQPEETGAQPARTEVAVTRVWRAGAGAAAAAAAVARVTADPHVNRHHQVRVHLRAVGSPIVGDPFYGRAVSPLPPEVPATRLALHASFLEIPHPSGARRVVVESALPLDLCVLHDWLDAQWTVEAAS